MVIGALAILIISIAIYNQMQDDAKYKLTPEYKAAEAKRQAAEEKKDAEYACMSSQRQFVRVYGFKLQQTMKNPDSFKRISMTKIGPTDWEIVYQATNSFNATMRESKIVTTPSCATLAANK